MLLRMLSWKKRTPQCREAPREPPRDATPRDTMDAGSATSATSSDASDGSAGGGGLVRLTDILRAAKDPVRQQQHQNMTVDARVDSRRKPLFREWTLKKSTSTTTAADGGEALPPPAVLQPGPSQDDLRELRAVEEQFRRGGDPAQVTQWLAAMAPKPPKAAADSAEADRELARRPLGELDAMERQLQRLEAQQQTAPPAPGAP